MVSSRRDISSDSDADHDLYTEEVEDESMELTYWLFGLLQLLGVMCVAVCVYWATKHLGGFEWDGGGKMLNWHPVLMVLGFVYVYGTAAVSYRVLRRQSKLKNKVIHASLNTYAMCMAIIGLMATIDYHHHQEVPDFYSIHSWVGMTTFMLFFCQLMVGLCAFLYPRFNDDYRAMYLHTHVYFGRIIFIMAIVACISGINQKVILQYGDTYSTLPSGAVCGNVLGVLILLFAMLVGFLLFKRL